MGRTDAMYRAKPSLYEISSFPAWNEKEVSYESMRSSGPGGQHVNKTESAVRATHLPSGISTTASDERSQAMNKKSATERLKNKLLGSYVEKQNEQVREKWLEHHSLERGNAVKVFKESLDLKKG
jgi:peptide chain release factor